jgi:mRNA interferase RelE/StbE
MASYSVRLTATAEKQLRKAPKRDREPLANAITSLSTNPRPRGIRKLSGYDDVYRLRVGRYRVLYEIADQRLVVLVLKLGHRKDVYR